MAKRRKAAKMPSATDKLWIEIKAAGPVSMEGWLRLLIDLNMCYDGPFDIQLKGEA